MIPQNSKFSQIIALIFTIMIIIITILVMIIAVASPPGAGKTHWIHQQIAQTNKSVGYFSPQTDSVPIDATYLQSEYPQLKLYRTREEAELNKTITYLEIPWYLDLAGIEPLGV